MPLRLDIKRKFARKSGMVLSVDLHPTEPWILTSLDSGSVCIQDYQYQNVAKSFEVTGSPVKSAKFVPRKQWVVCGANDKFIRVYNYNTMDKVIEYEAHTDCIRCVVVHPTLPYILSASDDGLIKLWDWEKRWYCTQIFRGHSSEVMQVTINPKDTNTFASASYDGTIKVWNLGSPDPNFTIDADEKMLTCVDYFTYGDKPYLIFGSLNHGNAKVWDYQTKTCVQTIKAHSEYVTSVCLHPELPIIITCSIDGTIRIWHSTTYRLENTLDYDFENVYAIGYMKGSRRIAIGHDEGTVMVKVGKQTPIASMDNSGNITWAKLNEIQTVNVGDDYEVSNGERLPLAVKKLGTCDHHPQSLKHNPDGMFVVVCGDGEYIMHTALTWGEKIVGFALEIVWSSDGEYAIWESTTKIKIFNKSFQEKKSIGPTFSIKCIYGGYLLAMCSNGFICFYDWDECRLIQRIDVNVKKLYWANSGDMLAISSDSSFYIFHYNNDLVDEQGIQDSFKLVYEVKERVRTGLWFCDCFIYINSSWRLSYCVGGEVTTMFHLDRPMYLLGYLENHGRVYLIDKEFNVIGYTLPFALIKYKSLVMRGDLARATTLFPSIPKEHHNSVAHFMESRGMIGEALEVSTDPDHRFELAIQLGKLEIAKDIALVAQTRSKWKQVGELAMSTGVLDVAEDHLKHANDLRGLVQLYSVLGNAEEIRKLTPLAKEAGENSVAFSCLFMLGKFDECLQILVDSNRMPQAALMARAYLPSKVSEIVALWRKDLNKVNQTTTDPKEYPNRCEDWQVALEVEARVAKTRGSYPVTEEYVNYGDRSHVSLVEVFKHMQLDIEKTHKNRELGHKGIRQPRASSHSQLGGGKSQYPKSKEVDAQGVEENTKEGEFIDGQNSSSVYIEKLFVDRTLRVESIDVHPTNQWVLLGFPEKVCMWNFKTRIEWMYVRVAKSGCPGTLKFIVRKDWIVFGLYDGFIYVYEYHNNNRMITKFKAHNRSISSLAVHPSLPYILSASDDDDLIKLWDWDNGWECTKKFPGHKSVKHLAFNPRDTNVFAGVSGYAGIKIWNLGSPSPHSSIKCRFVRVNSFDFFDIEEKPNMVAMCHSHVVKVWDYETGTCVKILKGHTNTVTSVCVDSNNNFIITGSNDNTVRIWNATTYDLEHVFTPELGKVKTMGFINDSSQIILVCEDGIFVGQVIPARC